MKILFTGIVQNTTISIVHSLVLVLGSFSFFFQFDPSLIFQFLHNSNLNRILAILGVLDIGGREARIFIIQINLLSINAGVASHS